MVCTKCGKEGHKSCTCKANEYAIASYNARKPQKSKKKKNATKKEEEKSKSTRKSN